MPRKSLSSRRILMIIAPENFRDEELFEPRRIFEHAGAEVTLAASRLGTAYGMLGGMADPKILISDAKADDYDAIVVVGGRGVNDERNCDGSNVCHVALSAKSISY